MKTPVLETERLILRPVTLDDAPAIQKYFNNWNIIQHLNAGIPWPYPDDGAETFLRNNFLPRMQSGISCVWAITIKTHGDDAVGVIDFGGGRSEQHEDRGFWLAEPFHGHGYMTEAVAATQDYLFFEVGIERFLATNAITNKGSRRVKQKTGAQFLKTGSVPHHNGVSETEIWEVTREEWEKIRNKNAASSRTNSRSE